MLCSKLLSIHTSVLAVTQLERGLRLGFSLPLCPQWCKKSEEKTTRRADLNWPKGCPTPHIIVLSNYSSGKGKREEHLWLWHFSSQAATVCDKAQLSSNSLDTFLLMGNKEFTPCFNLLAHSFVSVIKLSSPWLTRFPLLVFQFSSLSCCGQWASYWVGAWLPAGVNPPR